MDWTSIKHFKASEFASPDLPGSGDYMNQEFVQTLDQMRDGMGMAIAIASGYRTPSHNAAVGGEVNSAHLRGYAADIRTAGSSTRSAIVIAAVRAGFTRIGIGDDFVHIDSDPSLPSHVLWLYSPNTKRS